MNVNQESLEKVNLKNKSFKDDAKNVFFWTFLGPVGAISTLSLLFLKAPGDLFYLPIIAVVGLALTWSLKLKGFLLSLALLIALSFSQIVWIGDADSLWFLGSVGSLALSFFVTFLTVDEAESTFKSYRGEAREYLENFTTLFSEKEELVEKIKLLESQKTVKDQEFEALDRIRELATVELIAASSQKENLNREIVEAGKKRRDLELLVEEAHAEKEDLLKLVEKFRSDYESALSLNKEKTNHVDRLSREKDFLESTLSRFQAELESKEKDEIEEKLKKDKLTADQIDQIHQEYALKQLTLNEQVEALNLSIAELEKALKHERSMIKTEDQSLKEVPSDFVFTEADSRRQWGQLKQLKDQFAAKSSQLDETRKELFLAQEKAAYLEKQLTEFELNDTPQFNELSLAYTNLQDKQDRLEDELQTLEALITTLTAK